MPALLACRPPSIVKSEREKYVIEHTCGSQFESFSCTDEDSQAEDDEDEDEARSDHYPFYLVFI